MQKREKIVIDGRDILYQTYQTGRNHIDLIFKLHMGTANFEAKRSRITAIFSKNFDPGNRVE